MPPELRVAYLAHSFRSDWNNGNAHFLRGLMRGMVELGHDVKIFEPCCSWSIQNLREEDSGRRSLDQFRATYPDLSISTYSSADPAKLSFWRDALRDRDIVILHEWNPPELAHTLLELRDHLGFRLLFHDTHHRASSSPEQIRLFGTNRFDGILAFGEALRRIYQDSFGINRVWTLHEAADVTIFHPRVHTAKMTDVVWIGNWGDDERSQELSEFLLEPAAALSSHSFAVYGVRYPQDGVDALHKARVQYRGYLPNLDAPSTYASARLTVHIPRQQYASAMHGIPTIRVFEALACGIPLISAPWQDSENLFREGDFTFVRNAAGMKRAMEKLLSDTRAAEAQALRGLETILSRHTCRHRAEELTSICQELLR
ncbi:MAG TPA: glycosyltransferase [Silvibacterium sp.]|nr:glycosyltransferase [Silvibacterium sp.]